MTNHHHQKSTVQQNGRRPLSELKPGERGVIESVETSPDIVYKLMEMGLGPGEPIRFIREAPFGDPLVYEIMSYRLAIRKSEADRIFLKSS